MDGRDITDLDEQGYYAVRKRCAMVFQHSTLFDSMTLVQNVMLPLRKHRGLVGEPAREVAMDYLAKVQMQEQADQIYQSSPKQKTP